MHPALLIIDMINRFDFDGGPALARHAATASSSIQVLRATFHAHDWPVLFVNDNFMDWNSEFSDLVTRCRQLPGAPGQIASALEPQPSDYYVLKPRHSAFLCTTLPAILADLGAKSLVIVGVATDSCVLASVQDAHMRGYTLHVPRDAVASKSPARSRRALALMEDAMQIDTRPAKTLVRSLLAT